jgi:hypothetical protein
VSIHGAKSVSNGTRKMTLLDFALVYRNYGFVCWCILASVWGRDGREEWVFALHSRTECRSGRIISVQVPDQGTGLRACLQMIRRKRGGCGGGKVQSGLLGGNSGCGLDRVGDNWLGCISGLVM